MNRRLRRRHLRTILVLTLLLPTILVAGWLARPQSTARAIPAELAAP